MRSEKNEISLLVLLGSLLFVVFSKGPQIDVELDSLLLLDHCHWLGHVVKVVRQAEAIQREQT